MDLIGKVLGNRYEIIEKIGTGGMATVYKARDRVLNRSVAVKVLKDEFSTDVEFIKRFQVEAQSAASLSHQNIVSIFDVGNDNGMHYIVMELIDGKTLKEVIDEKGKLPWSDAVKIAAQIASGLSQAHKNHIVHRDIKPHNIIITREGVAKVTDFGIAKAVSNSTINAFGTTLGSVHYFSPEHARGGYTDEKSDIYSLGVVLYEMCTGKLPFDAETPVSVALKHLQEVPEEPLKLNTEIPSALNDIILKAMQKEVASRYASADALYNDLKRVLKNPDDISLKDVNNTSQSNFTTRRIPVVNPTTKDEKINEGMSKIKKEQDDEEMSKKRVTKGQALIRFFVFMLFAALVFFGCVKGGMFISEQILGTSATVVVPKIEGYSKEEAEKMLNDLGLKMYVEANVVDSNYPVEGFIVYQEYKEGAKVKEEATINVRVSKGASQVVVPDITTMHSVEGIKAKLGTVDLEFIEAFEFHDTIAIGDIIRQEPEGGKEVEKGSSVTVFFSKGPESGDLSGDTSGDSGLVKVPHVVGFSETEAKKLIDAAKLIANVSYVSSTVHEKGIVIGQTPEADSYKAELSEVVITVNKGEVDNKDDNSQTGSEDSGNTGVVAKRIVTIDLSTLGAREKFNVKVVIESNVIGGKKVEYEAVHTRDDGKIDIPVTDIQGAMLKVYIDDEVQYEMLLQD